MSTSKEILLSFIIEYKEKHGWAPSYTEMSEAVGIVRSAIAAQLNVLENEGRIKRGPRMARAITVCEEVE